MKALTIIQPWASLIACGAKRFETRSWSTKYRGQVAIHAGLKAAYEFDNETCRAISSAFKDYAEIEDLSDFISELPHGAFIAIAELVDCQPTNHLNPSEAEYLFGDWTPGRYAWEFINVRRFQVPIPTRGFQGLWNWDNGGLEND